MAESSKLKGESSKPGPDQPHQADEMDQTRDISSQDAHVIFYPFKLWRRFFPKALTVLAKRVKIAKKVKIVKGSEGG